MVIFMPSLNDAIALAVKSHDGQIDKGGQPYILHPLRVMLKMTTEQERIVAMLHDVVEDCGVLPGEISLLGYDEAIRDAIDHLSRRRRESYEDFIRRISECDLAAKVKIADLEDNMDMSRLKEITDKDRKRYEKYLAARDTLMLVKLNRELVR